MNADAPTFSTIPLENNGFVMAPVRLKVSAVTNALNIPITMARFEVRIKYAACET